jgi:hypothetical protein
MEYTVEFYGMPRRLSGVSQAMVNAKPNATLRDIVDELVTMYPSFLGNLVDPKTRQINEPYFFNIDARYVPKNLDYQPKQGERLLLLFLEAGG